MSGPTRLLFPRVFFPFFTDEIQNKHHKDSSATGQSKNDKGKQGSHRFFQQLDVLHSKGAFVVHPTVSRWSRLGTKEVSGTRSRFHKINNLRRLMYLRGQQCLSLLLPLENLVNTSSCHRELCLWHWWSISASLSLSHKVEQDTLRLNNIVNNNNKYFSEIQTTSKLVNVDKSSSNS